MGAAFAALDEDERDESLLVDNCSGSVLLRSLMKFVFSASLRAKSELLDVCDKVDLLKLEAITRSIAEFFAWRPLATAYRSPGLESSLLKCRGSLRSWLEGIAVPPESGLDNANLSRESFII